MKKKVFLPALMLALAVFMSSCGSVKTSNSADMMVMPSSAPSMEYTEVGKEYDNAFAAEDFTDGGIESPIYNDPNAKVIRTASLTIQTTEFEDAVAALARLTEEKGGYYESARVDGGGVYDQYARRTGYYVIRIPKENYLAFRNATGTIGHVYSITEETVDVGESYYDTEARLATLKTKHERLLSLLEKAENMEDIISLESALADVQYQIDMHSSTLRKYDSLIGFSTFTVWLEEVVKISNEPGVKESFGSRLVSSLKSGFEAFGTGIENFALWLARNLIGVILFLGIAGAVAAVVYKKAVRRRKKKENKTDQEA